MYTAPMFAQLGIPTYGIRACAQVRDDQEKLTRTTQEIFIINFVMTILAYIVFFGGLFTVPRLRQDKMLFLIVSTTLLFNAIGMEWLYKALEQYTYITVRSVIFKFIAQNTATGFKCLLKLYSPIGFMPTYLCAYTKLNTLDADAAKIEMPP